MVLFQLPLAVVESLSVGNLTFLVIAIALALAFEFVNGFHDTANAVATVIYTHTLPPWVAVIWSGLCNLAGVLVSSGAVAYSILALLPIELVIRVGTGAGFAMIFALLVSAICWNLGTWYLGLPASSSHTLIGSILGVSVANALLAGNTLGQGMQWIAVRGVFLSLLISPLVGFLGAGLLLLILRKLVPKPALFEPPPKDQPPPRWIRGILMLTCTGVSFAHGSNDGQKGMGLLLLILIAILPAEFALNLRASPNDLGELQASAAKVQPMLDVRVQDAQHSTALSGGSANAAGENPTASSFQATTPSWAVDGDFDELCNYVQNGGVLTAKSLSALAAANKDLSNIIAGKTSLRDVAPPQRKTLRTDLYLIDQTLGKLSSTHQITDTHQQVVVADYRKVLDRTTKYLPIWVKVAVAFALGCGTMVGWKRIVVTVGEKIGKEHLNYAQGASAELVAMATIGAADWFGMPVSTTHVLSSGVAGTMAANRSGLQAATLRNVLLAWVLTLPVCVLLGAATFAAGLYIVFKQLVPEATAICAALAILLIGRRIWLSMSKNPPAPQAVAP